jgi:glycosyltransferase involved in cell wall biosynthesis
MISVLYLSALASERRITIEYNRTGKNPGFAVQKFSRLLVKGLQDNDIDVYAISNPPNLAGRKRIVRSVNEIEDGVRYKYVPYLNLPIIKHICLFIYVFIYVLFWGIRDRRNKTIVCDVLSVSICMGALLASKINGVQSIAVVTDIYGMMVGSNKTSFISRLAAKLNSRYVSQFDKYVLLTEQMNDVVNPKCRPHIVMEALCDSTLLQETHGHISKSHPRTVIYAGGIYEKYGLKMLAEGFIMANVPDAKLVYYGEGSYVEEYKALCEEHPNLEYRGVAPNEEILYEEQKATLLVNPRFTTEEFTKYSFPSKNMEYMASGTPLLTTKLSGMPKEYYPYVFLFEEETVEGYADAISNALTHSESELFELGLSAKEFVLMNKNNVEQGKRICGLILLK